MHMKSWCQANGETYILQLLGICVLEFLIVVCALHLETLWKFPHPLFLAVLELQILMFTLPFGTFWKKGGK